MLLGKITRGLIIRTDHKPLHNLPIPLHRELSYLKLSENMHPFLGPEAEATIQAYGFQKQEH